MGKIVDRSSSSSNPRSYSLEFSTWSLGVMAGFLMYDLKTVDRISHAEIRNILLKHKIKWRKSKTILSNKSNDPQYDLKKVYPKIKILHAFRFHTTLCR